MTVNYSEMCVRWKDEAWSVAYTGVISPEIAVLQRTNSVTVNGKTYNNKEEKAEIPAEEF